MRSIEGHLLSWIIGTLTVGMLVVTLVSYLFILEEMNEVFDADLRNVATAVAIYRRTDTGPESALTGPAPAALHAPASADSAPEYWNIVTQIRNWGGRRSFVSDPAVTLPFSETEGLTYPVANGAIWVVYTAVRPDGIVQAGQRRAGRSEIARESAVRILTPLLLLVVIVGGFIVVALRRGLRPLEATASLLAARSEHSLEPLPTDSVPREIMPLVVAINGLMQRLASALQAQRRFLADAAHGLRTPAAAVRLQAQLIEASPDERTRAAAMVDLKAGIGRSQRLIEQLLEVSRCGVVGEASCSQSCDLAKLARLVVSLLSINAEHTGVDLGVDAAGEVFVSGDSQQLTVLLNNLIDNALRYTPYGGTVDVFVGTFRARPILRVIDSGPGIEPIERERVFDRFYRGEGASERYAGGSGLGLSIVKAIADQHSAEVSLHTPASGIGLEVRVVFMFQDALAFPTA